MVESDARGLTVMPGLIDGHCHISFDEPNSNDELFFHRRHGLSAIVAAQNARKVLQSGVTGIMDADSIFELGVDLRDAIEAVTFDAVLETIRIADHAAQGWGLAGRDQDRVLQMLLPDVPDAGQRRAVMRFQLDQESLVHLARALVRVDRGAAEGHGRRAGDPAGQPRPSGPADDAPAHAGSSSANSPRARRPWERARAGAGRAQPLARGVSRDPHHGRLTIRKARTR
ncbi:MAG: hypothetical protein HC794_10865 [Nitrospiraceae bacterium]|nr:hypothetical protein [Nitrospiraceae bacterium]